MRTFPTREMLRGLATITAVGAITAVLAATQTGSTEECPAPRPWSVELLFAPCVATASYRAAAADRLPVPHERYEPPAGTAPRAPAGGEDPAVARRAPYDPGVTGSTSK